MTRRHIEYKKSAMLETERLIGELENKGMLDEAMLDLTIFKLKLRGIWSNQHALWQKWLRVA